MSELVLDDKDREIVNTLQGGFEIVERPFREAAARLDIEEDDLIERVQRLVDGRALSRFGPMYNAEKLGGDVTLCALAVPEERFNEIAERVNAHREVAHNYARTHDLMGWVAVAGRPVATARFNFATAEFRNRRYWVISTKATVFCSVDLAQPG